MRIAIFRVNRPRAPIKKRVEETDGILKIEMKLWHKNSLPHPQLPQKLHPNLDQKIPTKVQFFLHNPDSVAAHNKIRKNFYKNIFSEFSYLHQTMQQWGTNKRQRPF